MNYANFHSWLRYWGKAQPNDDMPPDHPLVFHSLDVAACARVYLERTPKLLDQLATWLGIGRAHALGVATFLLAVHDIGKFAENFQNKAPDVARKRFEGRLAPSNSRMHHVEVSTCFFDWLLEKRRLPDAWHGWPIDIWRLLLNASFGHHGMPPASASSLSESAAKLETTMFESSRSDAFSFFNWCAEEFLPNALLPCDEDNVQLASWWIAGLAVLADWIGSNTTWFAYADDERRKLDPKEYWENWALLQARAATEEAGVVAQPTKPWQSPEALLRSLQGVELRPAQKMAAELPLAEEPQIFFLEDATGSGKTEAALILTARLIDAGLADGMYFGLPTQATADQMFERVDLNVSAWFEHPHRASIVLAHGSRDQVFAFAAKLDRRNDDVAGEPDSATLRVTQWLAESNKRAIQAQIGIGTLDQALMAILRVKHQSLRVLGMFGKVLLVDEVHSYDPYMTKALCETLHLHAAAGGSAILLSATMSLALRTRLLNAYAQGIALWRAKPRAASGRQPRSESELAARSRDYPLLTRWYASLGVNPDEEKLCISSNSQRKLKVDYVSQEDVLLERIDHWMAKQQAIVWVRNTVGDACDAYKLLVDRYGAKRVALFHSRFAAIDRRRIQNYVLEMLGKNSDASLRHGKIVVATQVLQESLDVDADQMISDLSYIDVMLQRFGRYRRHLRDACGNLLPANASGPDGRADSAVVVHGPDRDVDPDKNWYQHFSSGAAKVYGAHGKVFLSAHAVCERIDLPQQYRTLIEHVYGEDGPAAPETLLTADDRVLGQSMAQQAQLEMGAITLANGYRRNGDWNDDERIGTRLGDSIEATLVRVEDGALLPWARGRCSADEDEWTLSAIRVPGWWMATGHGSQTTCADTALATQVEQLKLQQRALKYCLVLPLVHVPEDEWICELAGQKPINLSYREDLGLHRKQ